ncbi:MAG: SoxR reducing system RseC family protein [Melioribacteraceae bacterium]|nr:SoxR reducing system RseC family protein [Melioribacteraceae bacterium]
MKEQIIEEGIIIKAENGFAKVDLSITDGCEECTAKIFCKPSEEKDDAKVLTVEDPIGVKIGDRVKVSVREEAIFKASIILYGIPLIIMMGGIIFGMEMFSASNQPELYSFLFSVSIMAGYYTAIFLWGVLKKKNARELPKIISIVN